MTDDTYFDTRHLSATDAHFVRQWQLQWLREYPHASPREIQTATQKAIAEGAIQLGVQR